MGASALLAVIAVAVWLCIHQIGYAWRDGRLPATPTFGWPLLIGGSVGLFLITLWGPYPVSVVTAPAQDEPNTEPPTLVILALAAAQIGVTYLIRRPLRSWLERPRPWMAVVAINSMILTIFLWHMAAAVLAVLLLYATGVIPVVDVGSPMWFVLRLPWLVGCLVMLAILVAIFAPIERAAPRSRKGARTVDPLSTFVAWAAMAALVAAMLGIAVAGPSSHGPLGLPTWALAAYAIGTVLLTVASRRLDGAMSLLAVELDRTLELLQTLEDADCGGPLLTGRAFGPAPIRGQRKARSRTTYWRMPPWR